MAPDCWRAVKHANLRIDLSPLHYAQFTDQTIWQHKITMAKYWKEQSTGRENRSNRDGDGQIMLKTDPTEQWRRVHGWQETGSSGERWYMKRSQTLSTEDGKKQARASKQTAVTLCVFSAVSINTRMKRVKIDICDQRCNYWWVARAKRWIIHQRNRIIRSISLSKLIIL